MFLEANIARISKILFVWEVKEQYKRAPKCTRIGLIWKNVQLFSCHCPRICNMLIGDYLVYQVYAAGLTDWQYRKESNLWALVENVLISALENGQNRHQLEPPITLISLAAAKPCPDYESPVVFQGGGCHGQMFPRCP